MKHIRLFEDINVKLKVGHWVICKDVDSDDKTLSEFLSNNIGRYIRTRTKYDINTVDVSPKFSYMIQYYNIPNYLEEDFHFGEPDDMDCRIMCKEEILFWSKNKEDLEFIINANKYNI